MKFPYLLCLLLTTAVLIQCKGKKEETHVSVEAGTYFSIIQFADDQFRTYWRQPFTFLKIIRNNEDTDSSFVAAQEVDWAKELRPFFDSDISHARFLDRYRFSVLNDDVTVSRTYFYEAKEDELFTRNLQIITDPFTNKVKNIYIETEKDGMVQKLYYTPLRLIQIQQFDKTLLGKQKNLRTEFRFLY